ncbi:Chondroitin proteoglycan-2 [Danaus plexippus plexippus]|uniref:Chondroitin proteoglycan-2 n=1 Tax=Danaus plexippus plexippus TaxID=278856 RepID=A0A212F4D0_DANPL|nr:Chondroitin proteoglycan-2 [Danaus plexippus plexippus]
MYLNLCLAAILIVVAFAESDSNICSNVIDSYIGDPQSCDTYIRCQAHHPIHASCPDGLNFNPKVKYPNFPCSYPEDVPCNGRAYSNPPKPTAECPRQNGYFPAPAASKQDCGRYRVCKAGKAIFMSCPTGLAFNPATAKCDWPDQVPSCIANDFFGFSCPPGTVDISGNPIITNHKHQDDCYNFFSCENGQARLLSCDIGYAFDERSGLNAQGGGRFSFPSRFDFRRPIVRPWARPSVSAAPDTPKPTERSSPTEKSITTEKPIEPIPTTKAVSSTISPIVIPKTARPSLTRMPPRGRFGPQPVFGPKPGSVVTNSPIDTSTGALEIVTPMKMFPEYYPVLSTTESNILSTRSPFVPNRITSNSHQNFDPRSQNSLFMSHNANEDDKTAEYQTEKAYSVVSKTTSELPLSTQQPLKAMENSVNNNPNVLSPLIATVSETEKIATTSKASLLEETTKYEHPSSLNPDWYTKSYVSKPTTTVPSTPKIIIVPAITVTSNAPLDEEHNNEFSNFNIRDRVPPYTSHALNVRIPENRRDFPSSSKFPSKEIIITAATTEKPPSTTDIKEYQGKEPSTNEPLVKVEESPFKIVSTTEGSPAKTNVYKLSTNGINSYKDNYYEQTTFVPKIISTSTKEPKEYAIPISTSGPLIGVQKMDADRGFTPKNPEIWVMENYDKTKTPTDSYKSDTPIYPIYSNNNEANYDELQRSITNAPTIINNPTTIPKKYTIPTTSKPWIIDDNKKYVLTTETPIEYTSQYEITTEPTYKLDTYSTRSVYLNNNEENYFKENEKPEVTNKTNLTQSYRAWYHKTDTPPTKPPKATIIQLSNNNRYSKTTTAPKPSVRYTTPQPRNSYVEKVYDIGNFKCKDDGFYAITNQCDDFIECKSGVPIQNSCPDGLHFNPAAKHSEFPCSYPSEVKCENQAASHKAQPTSECPRRYGYFSLPSGGCDKYIMCQEGLATVMSCPPGLAFNIGTSSCDWPSNVPDCVPDVFEGFICPAPELDEDSNPVRSIYKYR